MSPEWVAALTALVVAVFTAAMWLASRMWRIMRRATHFFDDYFGRPAGEGQEARPGVMARLTAVERQLDHVVAETSPNHGQSLRDMVVRTASDVADVKNGQAAISDRMDSLEAQHSRCKGTP